MKRERLPTCVPTVNLSDFAIRLAADQIRKEMGEEYVKTRKYKTTSKGAQEAHEAIRPTYLDKPSISGTAAEQRLYDLIYKRTIASQMSDAKIEKTNVNISQWFAICFPGIGRGNII